MAALSALLAPQRQTDEGDVALARRNQPFQIQFPPAVAHGADRINTMNTGVFSRGRWATHLGRRRKNDRTSRTATVT